MGLAQGSPPVVEKHQLDCGVSFPCPPEIQRRVDFWIKVFRTWDTDQLVFHDRSHPARVYSVITSEHSCNRSRSARSVEKERKRVKQILLSIAKKLSWAEPGWTKEEELFLALFPEKNPAQVSRAAERIRCQQGNRDRFGQALRRFGRYKHHILDSLEEAGLSEEFVYLPFVESAYNPEAYSRAGAAGLWQIMPRTARVLGLQLNATLDERFDPKAATRGAIKYLRDSTDRLGKIAKSKSPSVTNADINPFVITSYNYGVAGMARAIRSVGVDYIKVLNEYRSRSFRTAVRNFYASFLAARYVAKNADKYFKGVSEDQEQIYSPIVLKHPTSVERIVKVFGANEKTLKRINPALTRNVWNGWRLMPQGYALNLPYRSEGWDGQVSVLNSLPIERPQLSGKQYVVQRGDTACEIAKIFQVRCRDLIELNALGRRALIRVGQKLDIPGLPKPTKTQRVASVQDGRYLVQRGDTACEIARSFGVNCRALIKQNRLGKKAVIHIGQSLIIPGLQKQVASASKSSSEKESQIISSAKTPTKQQVVEAISQGSPEDFQKLMEKIDISVFAKQKESATLYFTRVLPEETLGHYADWLRLGGTSAIRKMNNMRSSSVLNFGKQIFLPIKNEEQRLEFEANRLEYHRTLVDQFVQHYDVKGIDEYTIRSGDTLWEIARKYDLPYWVLTRSNIDMVTPIIGNKIVIPLVQAKKTTQEPLVSE